MLVRFLRRLGEALRFADEITREPENARDTVVASFLRCTTPATAHL